MAHLSLRIVIVGGGLSGLAAAIGLSRANHIVTVLEQTSELREVGAGVQIPANSSRVLDELGVLDEIRKHSVEPIDLLIRSYRGEELYKQNLHPAIQKKFHFSHLLIHRADFRRILFDEARKQGVNVCLGACVESIDFAASKVELVAETSAGAGKSYTADLILGADGEHSICRELLLGRNDPPRSSGDIVFRLAVPAAKLAVHPSTAYLVRPPAVHAWYGQDSHAIGYQLMKDGIFNVVLTIPETKGEATIGPQPADLDAVRAHCVDWDPNFQHLLRSADKALKWTLLQTNEPETWVDKSGRFALLGDSAHASLPYLAQGAAIALESAITLSTLLHNVSRITQIPNLLELYQKMRAPRARRMRQQSNYMHDICQLVDGPAQIERDRVFREEQPGEGFPNPWADPGFQRWMWDFDAKATAERALTILNGASEKKRAYEEGEDVEVRKKIIKN